MVELIKQDFAKNRDLYKVVEKNLREYLDSSILIDHVGSTAIPNMYGKNIIDVLIGVDNSIQFNEAKNNLLENGFIPSENSRTEIYQFFASKAGETGSGDIHIHLVMKNTDRYDQFIVLRDYLLNNEKEVKDYSDFKINLVNSGIVERKEYKRIKAEYVTTLIKRAMENKTH